MEDQPKNPNLESLLLEMIANQQSIHNAVAGLYEKLDRLERTLTETSEAQVEARMEERVEDLYEQARLAVREAGKA